MRKNNKPKSLGKMVSISPKAHEIMSREAFESKPRLTLRELINIKVGISKEE